MTKFMEKKKEDPCGAGLASNQAFKNRMKNMFSSKVNYI